MDLIVVQGKKWNMDSNDDRCMDRVFTVDLEDESAVGALIMKKFIPASFLWEVTGFLRIVVAVLPGADE